MCYNIIMDVWCVVGLIKSTFCLCILHWFYALKVNECGSYVSKEGSIA